MRVPASDVRSHIICRDLQINVVFCTIMSFFANWCRFPSSASIRFLSVVHLLWAIGNKLVSLLIVSNRLVRSQRSFQPSLVKLVLLTIIVCYVFNPSTTEGLMKLERPIVWQAEHSLSTHPVAGGLMKPRPLKPLSTQAEKYITVGWF